MSRFGDYSRPIANASVRYEIKPVWLAWGGRVIHRITAIARNRAQRHRMLKRRILVADDNHDGAETMSALLRAMGHEVRTAYDGMQAVEIAAMFKPELILMDIGMPTLNGYDACRKIRLDAAGKEMFIVALSGWAQDKDRALSRDAGFDLHFAKPFDPEGLKAILTVLASRRSS